MTFAPALTRHLFNCPMDWAAAKRIARWPYPTGITPAGLEAEEDTEVARESGCWRKEDGCILHPDAREHFCWDKSTVEDLLRTKGRIQGLVDVPSVDLLESMTARLASEWKKQLLFLSKMRKLYLECVEAGDDGEDKWSEEHKRMHESTWPPTREIQGIPPADSEALKPWRTVLPEPAYKDWLEAILGPRVLSDYPEGKGIPRNVAAWLSLHVTQFLGQDPGYLHCFYRKGTPDLEYTREVVQRHRLAKLKDALLECTSGGTIRIPASLASRMETASGGSFEGNTITGLNQVLAKVLGMPDSKDTPDIVSDHMAWAAATAGPGWPEKYERLTAAGKQKRWFSTCDRARGSRSLGSSTHPTRAREGKG